MDNDTLRLRGHLEIWHGVNAEADADLKALYLSHASEHRSASMTREHEHRGRGSNTPLMGRHRHTVAVPTGDLSKLPGRWISNADVRRHLMVCSATVQRYARAGRIRSFKLPGGERAGKRRYYEPDVLAVISGGFSE